MKMTKNSFAKACLLRDSTKPAQVGAPRRWEHPPPQIGAAHLHTPAYPPLHVLCYTLRNTLLQFDPEPEDYSTATADSEYRRR